MITRAVGTEPSVEVETLTRRRAPGDLYLICSDGLTDIVRDEQIAELIWRAAEHDPDSGSRSTRRRREPGGRDRQHHGRALRDPRGRSRSAARSRADGRARARRGHDGAGTRDPAGRAGSPSAGAGAAPWSGRRRPLARACSRSCSPSPSPRSSSGGASAGERPQQGAPQPRLRSARRVGGVRERLDRRHRARLGAVARLRRRHLRPLPRGARRGPVHGSLRRSDAAPARRPADRDSG